MNIFLLVLRYTPIVLIAALAGTGLIVVNPGLFWDDWVWWFQSPSANIQIGRELGIWWGGYLSNAIYAAENPVLVLRLIALFSWIISALAFAYVALRVFRLEVRESVELFLLIVACHLGLIRFLNSVALYNAYIALFWLGVALSVKLLPKSKLRFLTLPFFFFSFYLNSLILLYGFFLMILFVYHAGKNTSLIDWLHQLPGTWRQLREYARISLAYMRSGIRSSVISYLKVYWVFVLLPFVFVAHKKLTKAGSDLYSGYNEIYIGKIISAIAKTFSVVNKLLKGFFEQLINDVPFSWIVIGTLVALLAITAMPRQRRSVSWRQVSFRLLIAVALAYYSLFPYVAVNKPPVVSDFYESRHVLVAIPAVVLLIHTLLISIGTACFNGNMLWGFTRNLVLAILIGGSLSASVLTAAQLWEDWYRQIAIHKHLERNADWLGDARLFLFQDQVPMRAWNRKIWNYEYTGMVVRAFGGRSRMGVSVDEYQSWPKKVPLLQNGKLKERFNMGDFSFGDGSPIVAITTTLGEEPVNRKDLLHRIIKSLIYCEPLPDFDTCIKVSSAFVRQDAEERILEMLDLQDAIYKYQQDRGVFPYSAPQGSGDRSWLTHHIIKSKGAGYYVGAQDSIGNIPGLFPDYIKQPLSMGKDRFSESYYVYMSDGIDFKLIYVDAAAIPYVKQARPSWIDKTRPESAYGFWTGGAVNW